MSDEGISTLKRWLLAVANGKTLHLSLVHLQEVIQNNLKVERSKLNQKLYDILPFMLVHYMKKWPLWSDLDNTTDNIDELVLKLQDYLKREIKFVIDYGYKKAVSELTDKVILDKCIDKSNKQCDTLNFAPYTLNIMLPATMLNTISFMENSNDIIVKEHQERPLENLSVQQLINWPYVEVNFEFYELKFTRRQATEYIRYLNATSHQYTISNKNVVESAEIKDKLATRYCYTYALLKAYLKCYLSTIKNLKMVTKDEYNEISTILANFVADIKDIGINESIATNTQILFKLCPHKYACVKKLLKLNSKDLSKVGYCEIQIPKIELCLDYFLAVQSDNAEEPSFVLLDEINANRKDLNKLKPKITYRCTFCKEQFENFGNANGYLKLLEHFKNIHKMEQPVRCSMCKKQFEITDLSMYRWRHNCVISV